MKFKLVLHGDNGSTFKATTVLAMLQWLRIKPSYSRPRVSDDNVFVESLFRTANYRSEFSAKRFVDLEATRARARRFVRRCNREYRHVDIRYVSPTERHDGREHDILAQRHDPYFQARERNPRRRSPHTRNSCRIDVVTLNSERESGLIAAGLASDTP